MKGMDGIQDRTGVGRFDTPGHESAACVMAHQGFNLGADQFVDAFPQSFKHRGVAPVESAYLPVQIAMLPALTKTVLRNEVCHAPCRIRAGRLQDLFARKAEFLDFRTEQLADQAGLGAEVFINGRDTDLGAGRDLLNVNRGITTLAEQRFGGGENSLFAVSPLAFAQAGHGNKDRG